MSQSKNADGEQSDDDFFILISKMRETVLKSPAKIFEFIENCKRIAHYSFAVYSDHPKTNISILFGKALI